jgi:hypothetical protein
MAKQGNAGLMGIVPSLEAEIQYVLKVLSSHLRRGSWVVSFDWPLNSLHFRIIFNFF